MATNDFLTFATDPGANVDAQAAFAGRANNLGFGAGSVATSSWANKLLRQASLITHMITQFIVDKTGLNAVDDGTTATLEANFIAAIQASIPASGVLSFNGRAGTVTLSSGDVTTALGAVPIFVGGTATGDLQGLWPGPSVKAGAITNAKMASMGAFTIKMNNTNAAAAPQDVGFAAVLAALGFDFSHIGANGYILGPNGFILQWGQFSVFDDQILPLTFNIPFVNAVYGVSAQIIYNGSSAKTGGNGGGTTVGTVTLSGCKVMLAWNGDATGIGPVYWWAWGV